MDAKERRYIPFLRWKAGEREAISKLSPAGKINVVPLILLGAEQYADTKAPPKKPPKRVSKRTPAPASDAFVEQLVSAWGHGSRAYLDASQLLDTGDGHHLDRIAEASRRLGFEIVPVTRRGIADDYEASVAKMVAADGRGVGLRVDLADMTSASTWAEDWRYPLGQTDLIIDLSKSVRDVAALGIPLLDAFVALHDGPKWRSVTVVGGSIPQMLTGFKVGSTLLRRSELVLWRALYLYGLPYNLDFGDYLTVAPEPLVVDFEGSFPINVKYTLRDEFFIRHGVRPGGEKGIERDVQFRSHARAIKELAARDKLDNCWGDAEIDRIAIADRGTAGSPTKWVAYCINRHIEITRHTLP